MTILGIDPGKSGAVAVLDEGGELLKMHDTPSNGMIRVTYGSLCNATQLGGMENAPKALARMILQNRSARRSAIMRRRTDICPEAIQAKLNKPPKSWATTATCLALVQAALRGCPTRLIAT